MLGVRDVSDILIKKYTEDYKVDLNTYHYVLYYGNHVKGGQNIGDWFNSMLYHFSINIVEKYKLRYVIHYYT